MDVEKIKKAAISEVLSPTFELTKQFLASNELCYSDGLPNVEDIIINHQDNKAEVYFPIAQEDYYFVVIIDLNEKYSPSFMNMSAGNRVYLFVSSEEHELADLLDKIDIEPTRKWGKGEKRGENGQYRNSGFVFEPIRKKTGEVEDKLKTIIEELLPKKEMILGLIDMADVQVQVSYHGYKDQMWGIHFDIDLIQSLSMLNLSLDIDLYASGKDLVEL